MINTDCIRRATSSAVCGVHFPAFAERLQRPQPDRGVVEIEHGCAWVRLWQRLFLTTITDLLHSDISEAFPNGEVSQYFRNEWLTNMARETRANKEFSQRTQDTARWAREQIKRQSGKTNSSAACPQWYSAVTMLPNHFICDVAG